MDVMDVAGTISGYVTDIGVDAVKDKIKDAREESEIRHRLNGFLERQQEYNLSCTLEEEIDFQGLAEYIRGDLLEDVKRRLFGSNDERGSARQSIMDKAAYYAQAKTRISDNRARQLACVSIDILRAFYREKVNRDLKFIAGEITDEMTVQHQSLEEEIEGVAKKVEDASVLSIDRNIAHIQAGNLDAVERNLSIFLNGISAVHTLPHDFRFDFNERRRLVSVPISDDALKRYPHRLRISAESIKMGDTALAGLDSRTLSRAYRHQLPISFDVVAARKYLGDILDPAQAVAEDMTGAHVVLYPPSFPEAFPCNVSIDGTVAVEYLLLRTKEILDDGTLIVTNDEQKNFNFKVRIRINPTSKQFSFSITPTEPTNYELLGYRLFLKKASSAERITVKALAENAEILSAGKLNPIDFDQLDAEIEFLERIITIERYFDTAFRIPEELRPEDHSLIHRLYSMIEHGVFEGKRKRFDFTLEVSESSRSSINGMAENASLSLAYSDDISVTLFDHTIEFPLLRRIDGARIEDIERLKRKVAVLDDGDRVRLRYVPADQDGFMTYSDVFYTEDNRQNLLYSHVE